MKKPANLPPPARTQFGRDVTRLPRPIISAALTLPPMKSICIPAIAAALLLTGCESTPHFNRTKIVVTGPAGAKRAPETVQLWQSREQVPAGAKSIAILSVSGDAGDEAAFLKAFLHRAASIGGDGVLAERVNLAAGAVGGGLILTPKGGFGGDQHIEQNGFWRGEVFRLQ